MSDNELEEYLKTIEPNFDSHIEKGTIEMSNEYYNLLEERMNRLLNENKQLKEEVKKHKKCIDEQNEELFRRFNSLDKATTLNSVFENILIELEEFIPKLIDDNIKQCEGIRFLKGGFEFNQKMIKNRLLDKIQELKEKYK